MKINARIQAVGQTTPDGSIIEVKDLLNSAALLRDHNPAGGLWVLPTSYYLVFLIHAYNITSCARGFAPVNCFPYLHYLVYLTNLRITYPTYNFFHFFSQQSFPENK